MIADPTRSLAGIKAAIDNLTRAITAALSDHGQVVKQSTADVVAAIDRLVEAQPPPTSLANLRIGHRLMSGGDRRGES